MGVEFVAYIDESGDEGFKFGSGSTEWFVLSAAIVRKSHDLQTVKLLDGVRAILNVSPKKGLHFRDLKHQQRLPYIDAIAKAPLCATTVFVHKPSIKQRATFKLPNLLYFYATRYLLERVSWYCAENRTGGRSGQGHVEIVFSNRGGMSYQDLADYLYHVKHRIVNSMDWSALSPDEIVAYSPIKRMGLQIADAVASSFFYAVEPLMHGYTEPRYATMLKPVVYCNGRNYSSYGLKFMPTDCQETYADDERLDWIRAY